MTILGPLEIVIRQAVAFFQHRPLRSVFLRSPQYHQSAARLAGQDSTQRGSNFFIQPLRTQIGTYWFFPLRIVNRRAAHDRL